MRIRPQRLTRIAAAALAVSGSLMALSAAARPAAANPVLPIVWLQRPDLVVHQWSFGQMWNPATNSPVAAVIVTVKNVGNKAANASTTRITHNGNIFNMPTPALGIDQTFQVAAPLTNNSPCGMLAIQVDANNNNVEWNETNGFALAIDCFPPQP